MNDTLYTLPKNCDFHQVDNNSTSHSECSPILTPKYSNTFEGILINGARVTSLRKGLTREEIETTPGGNVMDGNNLMIAGFFRVPADAVITLKEFEYQVLLVAVNQKTADVYSGTMIKFGIDVPLPFIPIDTNSNLVKTLSSYFNIDLIQNLDIPLISAEYTVYATLGKYKSNVLNISVQFNSFHANNI